MQRFIQLVLDGFDLRAEPQPPAAPAVPPAAPLPEAAGPAAPAQPLADVLAPARFTHPRATRRTVLQGTHVDYEFRRGRRRTIGFAIGVEGLVVSAPRWVALGDVEAALQEKAGWIVRKLAEQRERHQRAEAGRIDWRDGATLPFMGETVVLALDSRQAVRGGAVLDTAMEAPPGAPRLTLRLSLPHQAEPAQIRDATQAWLMRQA
ncbi:MAG: DUF45 domain-containing protein, partial [Burkholderiaceae bacterium]|nr:DUF45 domain-containing protein [Burkholderiaceae bacterium]